MAPIFGSGGDSIRTIAGEWPAMAETMVDVYHEC